MMDNTYPNDEFVKRAKEFREALDAFMETTDDEGSPNPGYTLDQQIKFHEAMQDKAFNLAVFTEDQKADGYRLVKADISPAPALDDDPWLAELQNEITIEDYPVEFEPIKVIDDFAFDDEDDELPHWAIDKDDDSLLELDRAFKALKMIEDHNFYRDGILTYAQAYERVVLGDKQDV